LATISDIFIGRTLPEVGELLYNRLGCKACHTTNGAKLVGPSFKDLYGFGFDTVQGVRITVDDAYVRESILTPNVSVVAGYQPVMTPFAGLVTDREIEAITAWLKTLSSKGGVEETVPAPDTEPGVQTGQEEN
jgi:cytochrome c oxidase subunit 2